MKVERQINLYVLEGGEALYYSNDENLSKPQIVTLDSSGNPVYRDGSTMHISPGSIIDSNGKYYLVTSNQEEGSKQLLTVQELTFKFLLKTFMHDRDPFKDSCI